MKFTLNEEQKKILEKNYNEAMKKRSFQDFVKRLEWSKEDIMKRTSKLEDACIEEEHCFSCKGLYECKNSYLGYKITPFKDHEQISFSYEPCVFTIKNMESKKRKANEEKEHEQARMKDIDVKDKKRVHVIKWLDDFFEHYDYETNQKGLYLHGSFGCGKTFLISALFNELREKKKVTTALIYYPELIRELKSDWELYDARMRQLQTVDILCLDDIGAEKVTEWSRDEVLGTILQYRMNQGSPTFFTSNLNLKELESHFILKEDPESKMKSRRIMERITQLSIPMEMISENKRK